VLALSPDAVIVATGAQFSRAGRSGAFDRPIPGADRPHVHSPEDILLRGVRPSGRVLVVDGEGTHAGSGIAEMLGRAGAEVTMVSQAYAPYSNRVLFAFEGEPVSRRLAEAGVSLRPATWPSAIGERHVTLRDIPSGREFALENVDAVVLVTGRLSLDGLASELEGKVAQLFTVGDALGVRPLATAAYEGQKFARLIGDPGAPRSVAEAWFAADDPAVYPAPAG
jgi:dimethylamine/trimethylamine dehydrogenase